MGERIRWLGHVERMENDRITKRVFVGECAGSRSVGRPRKMWIDTVKKVWMSDKQREWCIIKVRGECMGP